MRKSSQLKFCMAAPPSVYFCTDSDRRRRLKAGSQFMQAASPDLVRRGHDAMTKFLTRTAVFRAFVVIGTILISAAVLLPSVQAQTPRKFTFILDFLPYGEFSAFFLALDKGWYREEGLDVEILRGNGGLDTVKRIAAGQGDAGITDFSSIVAGVANEDVKVKGVASVLRDSGFSLYVRDDSGINSPKDLVGKSIGTPAGGSHQVLWLIVAQGAGIPVDSVKWITMDGASMGPALITGRVDSIPLASWHEKRLQMQAAAQNKKLKRFAYSDYGLDTYSLSIFARDESIQKNDDALRRFIRVSLRAIKYTWQEGHAREGAQAVVKFNPVVDLEAAAGASETVAPLAINKDITSGRFALGQFDGPRVESSRDMFVKYLKLKRTPAASELFTNTMLPETK
ncbi:MAG: ABC transporter substrate-binding protein [Variibacter sp.]